MLRFLLPVSLLLALQSRAQSFELTLPFGGTGEEGRAAVENHAGNFVVAGSSFLSGRYNVIVAEVSPSGAVVTARTIGTSSGELVNGLIQSSDGSYMLTGAVYDNANDYDWFLMKLDSTFQPLWYKRYGTAGNDVANSCAEIAPGHYLVTGTVAHGGSAKPASVVFDSSGAVIREGYLTTNQFASPNYRGRYFGNGRTGFCNLANAFSLLDTTGAIVYQLPENFTTFTRDAAQASGGGYFLAGVSGYGSPFGSSAAFGFADSMLSGLTSLTAYSKSGYDIFPAAMIRGGNGHYLAVVNAASLSTGNVLPLVMMLDAGGTLLASVNVLPPGLNSCQLNTVLQTSGGGFLATGMSATGQGLFIVLLDSAGNSCSGSPYLLSASSGSSVSVVPHAAYSAALPAPVTGIPAHSPATPAATVYCNPAALQEAPPQTGMRIFPTVFRNEFFVDAGGEPVILTLTDAAGRTVQKRECDGWSAVSCSRLPPGAYIARLSLKSGMRPAASFRMVKMSD